MQSTLLCRLIFAVAFFASSAGPAAIGAFGRRVVTRLGESGNASARGLALCGPTSRTCRCCHVPYGRPW